MEQDGITRHNDGATAQQVGQVYQRAPYAFHAKSQTTRFDLLPNCSKPATEGERFPTNACIRAKIQ